MYVKHVPFIKVRWWWTHPCLELSKLANSAQHWILSVSQPFHHLLCHFPSNSLTSPSLDCNEWWSVSAAKRVRWLHKAEGLPTSQKVSPDQPKTGSALGLRLSSLSLAVTLHFKLYTYWKPNESNHRLCAFASVCVFCTTSFWLRPRTTISLLVQFALLGLEQACAQIMWPILWMLERIHCGWWLGWQPTTRCLQVAQKNGFALVLLPVQPFSQGDSFLWL